MTDEYSITTSMTHNRTATRQSRSWCRIAASSGIALFLIGLGTVPAAYGDSQHQYHDRFDFTSSAPSDGTGIVDDLFAGSSSVACAAGTRDVGVADGYHGGKLIKIRLCALPNLKSTSEESKPNSRYYVQGAKGQALTNSRVSRAAFSMINAANSAHVDMAAISSFRTMAHQKALCNANSSCKAGNYKFVAKPGNSNHQMGLAIDFDKTHEKGGTSCKTRAKDPGSATWVWLRDHAATYGYGQYAAESWHWDPISGPTRR